MKRFRVGEPAHSARTGRIGALIAILVLGAGGIGFLLVARGAMERAARHAAPSNASGASASAAEWYSRGNDLLKRARDSRGAAEAYRRAVELVPGMGEAHYGLGYCLLQLEDYDGAIAEMESALSLAKEDSPWKRDAEQALVLAHLRKPHPEAR